MLMSVLKRLSAPEPNPSAGLVPVVKVVGKDRAGVDVAQLVYVRTEGLGENMNFPAFTDRNIWYIHPNTTSFFTNL